VPQRYFVVVTVRNGERWIERCLTSIRAQHLKNWSCVVVDDASTDGTWAIVAKVVGEDSRFTLRRNPERKWQARNTVETSRYATDPEDVIILVDGDDWLASPDAFDHIRSAYVLGAWMTYGNVVEHDGRPSGWAPYPQRIARAGAFHEWNWCATAPRSFKRFLLDELKEEDFTVAGEWPKVAGDVAVVLPLLQLACERAVPITAPIYVYNTDTPDNDHKTNAYEQMRVRDLIYDRPAKARLERA
jgi:glycosyltransferase involved in cell wall biosynthesis